VFSLSVGYLRRRVGPMQCVNTIHRRRIASTQITASSAAAVAAARQSVRTHRHTHRRTDTGTDRQTYGHADDEDVDSCVPVYRTQRGDKTLLTVTTTSRTNQHQFSISSLTIILIIFVHQQVTVLNASKASVPTVCNT